MAEAIEIAAQWASDHARQMPGFRGAHLMGGITSMPREAPFPASNDIDIGVLLEGDLGPGPPVIDESYRGAIIEAGLRSVDAYRSAEAILANPELADSLAANSVVLDPAGLLAGIQRAVSAEYRRRRWVMARCDDEKRRLATALERAAQATTPLAFLEEMTWVLANFSGLIAVALVRPPTHRRCLVLLRDSLSTLGREDLYEPVLAVPGLTNLSRSQVQNLMDESAKAFDRAVQVWRTPFPLDFKLRPHLRPYVVEGMQLMIDEGNYREAVPWLCLLLDVAIVAIRNDAPEGEAEAYEPFVRELVSDLGITTPAARAERLRRASEIRGALSMVADDAVDRLSDDIATASVIG